MKNEEGEGKTIGGMSDLHRILAAELIVAGHWVAGLESERGAQPRRRNEAGIEPQGIGLALGADLEGKGGVAGCADDHEVAPATDGRRWREGDGFCAEGARTREVRCGNGDATIYEDCDLVQRPRRSGQVHWRLTSLRVSTRKRNMGVSPEKERERTGMGVGAEERMVSSWAASACLSKPPPLGLVSSNQHETLKSREGTW